MAEGWVKYFADGTFEAGFDALVENKWASWSQGRLEDMTGVELLRHGVTLRITGSGEYWQSDDYVVIVGEDRPKMVKSRISKKIRGPVKIHRGKIIEFTEDFNAEHAGQFIAGSLVPNNLGKWLVVELDLRTKRYSYFISDRRR